MRSSSRLECPKDSGRQNATVIRSGQEEEEVGTGERRESSPGTYRR